MNRRIATTPGERPGRETGHDRAAGLLLFDGDCGICTALARRARKLDADHRFAIVPFQSLADGELQRIGLDRGQCDQALQMVTAGGEVRGGIRAVNTFLWSRPIWRPVVALLWLCPPLLLLEWIGYRLVARHRGWISRRLGWQSCTMNGEGTGTISH